MLVDKLFDVLRSCILTIKYNTRHSWFGIAIMFWGSSISTHRIHARINLVTLLFFSLYNLLKGGWPLGYWTYFHCSASMWIIFTVCNSGNGKNWNQIYGNKYSEIKNTLIILIIIIKYDHRFIFAYLIHKRDAMFF